ncbi:MAG: rRNA pseudouridine synthase [Oscillospiraceae bacterium]|nr:rRNA pseudouridine synthase [Oscillospiraceae bacterium]
MDRIQKIISANGVASRREAERMITAGRVTVNGAVAKLGDSADAETDEIRVDGQAVTRSNERVYIVLNKPRGVLTTMKDDRGRRTVADLTRDVPGRVYPVGRLDYESDGLLIMTNDGEFANRVMHPSHEVPKTYAVAVRGELSAAVEVLRESMTLDDGASVHAISVEQTGEGALKITIREGRNRQIRRMCEQCGLEVRRLSRVAEGTVTMGRLKPGEWRYLTKAEIRQLTIDN